MPMPNPNPERGAAGRASLPSVIGHIAGVIGSDGFPTGERAALRRLKPEAPPPLAFYRFAFRHLPESWPAHKAAWMAQCAAIAIMHPCAHRPKLPLGQALAEAGYSEARLERLLEARGTVLHVLLLRAARLLAAKNKGADQTHFARLLLADDPKKHETIRMWIARAFYQNTERKE